MSEKKRGRPYVGDYSVWYGVRITKELMAELEELAQNNGGTVSQCVRELIQEGIRAKKAYGYAKSEGGKVASYDVQPPK